MKNKIIIATTNKNKIIEIDKILSVLGITPIPISNYDDVPEIIEDGDTFEENALKKAEGVGKFLNLPVLADDSGLEVDALNGDPGVHSARYAGTADNNPDKNNELLLSNLKDVPFSKRTARFVCVITIWYPNRNIISTRGEIEGKILSELRGINGFGYDPLFVPDNYNASFAEIPSNEKNKISHRAVALKQIAEILKNK